MRAACSKLPVSRPSEDVVARLDHRQQLADAGHHLFDAVAPVEDLFFAGSRHARRAGARTGPRPARARSSPARRARCSSPSGPRLECRRGCAARRATDRPARFMARMPAPPVSTSVPSISKRTSLRMDCITNGAGRLPYGFSHWRIDVMNKFLLSCVAFARSRLRRHRPAHRRKRPRRAPRSTSCRRRTARRCRRR